MKAKKKRRPNRVASDAGLDSGPTMNRDLAPHKAARAAMWLHAADYAASGLGSMGYWDSLTKYRQAMCRQMVVDIERARPEESNAKLSGPQ